MGKLEEKNRQMKGRLFGVLGEGESTAFVFRTPKIEQVPQPDGSFKEVRALFLVVSRQGFRLIQAETPEDPENDHRYKFLLSDLSGIPNNPENARKYGIDPAGYLRFPGITGGGQGGRIGNEGIYRGGGGDEKAVRLVYNINPDIVGEIVDLNKQQVEQDDLRIKQEVMPHIQAARKIDEILG